MKSSIIISLLLLAITCYSQQDSLRITGVLKGQGNEKVFLTINDEAAKSVVSYKVPAKDDTFDFKVKKSDYPVMATFANGLRSQMKRDGDGKFVAANPAPVLELVVYQSDITINGEMQYLHVASVTGGKENADFERLKAPAKQSEKRSWEISRLLFDLSGSADTVLINKLRKESMGLRPRMGDLFEKFIEENPASFVSLQMLFRRKYLYTTDEYEKRFNELQDDYKQTPFAMKMKREIEFVSSTGSGKPSIPFTRIDNKGKEISLADYKGKIVLLDFWGSWCGPCRASHPHLKELYAKYKDKGFEIIAVAQQRMKTIEERKGKWLEAIEKDGINWVHVMNDDGNEAKQDIVKDYRVNAFPTKILLDKDGKILLRVTASATDDIDRMLEKKLGK